MEGIDTNTLIAIIAGVIATGQVLARVTEKAVVGLLEVRKEKKLKDGSKGSLEPGRKTGSTTTDLALQTRAIETLAEDLDETKRVAYDVKAATTKDLPHILDRLGSKIDASVALEKEMLSECRELRRAIDNNTAATKALHNFLATQSPR